MYVCAGPVDVQAHAVSGQNPCAHEKSQSPDRLSDWPLATVPALHTKPEAEAEAEGEAWA